jgi:hypothetical protein
VTDPGDGDPPAGTWLRRNAQHRVAGLTVGIMAVNPDPADPAVRLSLYDPDSAESLQVVLRPGLPAEALGRVLVAERIDPEARAAVLLTVRAGGAVASAGSDSGSGSGSGSGSDGGLGRVGTMVLVTSVAVALGLAAGVGAYAWRQSRPAPAMSQQAKQQGAVRLTYPVRHLPPSPTSIPVPGADRLSLELIDVARRDGRPAARLVAWTDTDAGQQGVWLADGQSAVVGRVRVTVVAAYDQPDPGHDAVDVVAAPAG